MSCDVGKVTEGLEKSCDVGEVAERLENELCIHMLTFNAIAVGQQPVNVRFEATLKHNSIFRTINMVNVPGSAPATLFRNRPEFCIIFNKLGYF